MIWESEGACVTTNNKGIIWSSYGRKHKSIIPLDYFQSIDFATFAIWGDV